jgi:hypothetical protein
MARPKFIPSDPNKVSQAYFAEYRGVARSTITVWKNRGLIVIDGNGMIDVAATDVLLGQRAEVYRGGVANQLPPPAPPEENPDARVLAAVVAMVGSIEAIVAASAVESGADLKTAYATATLSSVSACEIAEDILADLSIDVSELPVWESPGTRALEPSWSKLAKLCGERLNLTQLRAHAARLRSTSSNGGDADPPKGRRL